MLDKVLLDRIKINSSILAGKPLIRNLRISVDQILRSLASGISEAEILEDYPELEKDDIKACLLYAAKLVEHEKVFPLIAS